MLTRLLEQLPEADTRRFGSLTRSFIREPDFDLCTRATVNASQARRDRRGVVGDEHVPGTEMVRKARAW